MDPANGIVALTGISVGDTAAFACGQGFELVGTDTITCGNDGQWSEKPPVCNRNYIPYSNYILTCYCKCSLESLIPTKFIKVTLCAVLYSHSITTLYILSVLQHGSIELLSVENLYSKSGIVVVFFFQVSFMLTAVSYRS